MTKRRKRASLWKQGKLTPERNAGIMLISRENGVLNTPGTGVG